MSKWNRKTPENKRWERQTREDEVDTVAQLSEEPVVSLIRYSAGRGCKFGGMCGLRGFKYLQRPNLWLCRNVMLDIDGQLASGRTSCLAAKKLAETSNDLKLFSINVDPSGLEVSRFRSDMQTYDPAEILPLYLVVSIDSSSLDRSEWLQLFNALFASEINIDL